MKGRKANAHLGLVGVVMVLLSAGCGSVGIGQKPEDVVRSRFWTKQAFQRVEPRLKEARVGMSQTDFQKLIEVKAVSVGGQIRTLVADGWILSASASWKENGTAIREYCFGYIDAHLLVKMAVVRFEQDKLVSVRFLSQKGMSELTASEIEGSYAVSPNALYTREAFGRASERAKSLKVGMDQHEFEKVMGVRALLEVDNSFTALADGMLNELYEPNRKPAGGLFGKIWFGYRENTKPVSKFFVEFEKNKISKIEWLDQK